MIPSPGGIGGHQEVGAVFGEWPPKEFHLPFPFLVRHSAMYQGHLAGEAEPLQSADQEIGGVPVLREYDEFFAGVIRVP